MESMHAEGESPFVALDDDNASGSSVAPANDSDYGGEASPYVECPVETCSHVMRHEEMDAHLEHHAKDFASAAADAAAPSNAVPAAHDHDPDHGRGASHPTGSPPSPGRSKSARGVGRHHHTPERKSERSSRQATAISAWKLLLRMPGSGASSSLSSKKKRQADQPEGPSARTTKRLGLGRYHDEERMPRWLTSHIEKGVFVKAEGVIPVLSQMLEQCPATKNAYLCHPSVQHFSKLPKECGFCGYRNIQMLCSYIVGIKLNGYRQLNRNIPTIFQIQDFIEAAWDQGINTQGRVETGGIKGTRKYIGTPEALAMFRFLEIPCDAQGFKNKETGKSEALLMEEVENYFQSGVGDPTQRVRLTNLPPIYFQHAGHSLTIVGFERLRDGETSLLVFDPEYRDSSKVTKYVGRTDFEFNNPNWALARYRRGNKYLKRYREFEILR
ncbi:peptidase family C78-domain-containing protein [Lasiosphaeria ovina]|uniref:Peptidase family C78-domain-containing protein n=1 Tax=Lasiosphaeria ovina TaxID=92902 RepID=A0AAE0N8C2_9PEZI|nr:peptidase family C78-domain-containing protein [Lasiosphaeria ovina]